MTWLFSSKATMLWADDGAATTASGSQSWGPSKGDQSRNASKKSTCMPWEGASLTT